MKIIICSARGPSNSVKFIVLSYTKERSQFSFVHPLAMYSVVEFEGDFTGLIRARKGFVMEKCFVMCISVYTS